MHTPPIPTPPPTTGVTTQPPTPANPAKVLAMLVADGILSPNSRKFEFRLSDQQLVVNKQPQPATLLVKYQRYFNWPAGSANTLVVKVD